MSKFGDFWYHISDNLIPASHNLVIRRPFVKATQLAGKDRWRIEVRRDPTGPWLKGYFITGSRDEIEKHMALVNQERSKSHNQKVAMKRWRKQQEVHEQSEQGQPGQHVPGPMSKCPICRNAIWKEDSGSR